jgi:hypothetical protein
MWSGLEDEDQLKNRHNTSPPRGGGESTAEKHMAITAKPAPPKITSSKSSP